MAILKVANVHHDASGFTRTQISTANTYSVYTSNAERLTVDPSGNVGVGAASPTSKLNVVGTANITGSLTVLGSNVSAALIASNTYADTVGVAANGWANTISTTRTNAANGWANTISATRSDAANGWANTISATRTDAANGWANTISLTRATGANAWANTKLTNGTVTLAGTLTITGDTVVGGNVIFDAPASTRIWEPAANTLTVITTSVERVRIDASGNVGIGTSAPTTKLQLTGSASATINTLVDGATITPNFSSNNNFTVTLNGNRTLANPTGAVAGQAGIIFVRQGIGSNTLAFGNTYKFTDNTAPTLSTANGAVDAIVFFVRQTSPTTNIACQTILNVG